MIKVLALPRRAALESLDNRHYGINQDDVFTLALAMQRARRKLPEAQLQDALYVQALGLVLPTKFAGGSKEQDAKVLQEVVTVGPFAQSPFLDDVLHSAQAVLQA